MKSTYLAAAIIGAFSVGCALPWDSTSTSSSSSSSSPEGEGTSTSGTRSPRAAGQVSAEVESLCEKLAPSGCITACKKTGSCFKGDASLVKWIECDDEYGSISFHDASGEDDTTSCLVDSIVSDSSGDKSIAKGRKRAFVTSGEWAGDLGGTSADVRCALAATAGELGGTWKAFIASDGSDPIAHVEDVDGGWFNVKRSVRVFANRAALASSGGLSNTHLQDETGRVSINDWWTGSASESCSDWTSTSSGLSAPTGNSISSCFSKQSLLCVEQ